MLMFVVVWSSSLFSLGRSSFDMRVESSSSISLLVFVVSGWLILRGMTNGSGGGVVVFFLCIFWWKLCRRRIIQCVFRICVVVSCCFLRVFVVWKTVGNYKVVFKNGDFVHIKVCDHLRDVVVDVGA